MINKQTPGQNNCVKCGFDHTVSGAVEVEWGYWCEDVTGRYSPSYHSGLHPEALRLECVNCGYQWLREPEDA